MKPFSVFVSLAVLAAQATCQFTPPDSVSPFQMTGAISGITQSSSANLTGGTITVDGIVITVPKNLLATLPTITVGWNELFVNGASQVPTTKTWQATVFGNRVGNSYIAGLVYIAQMENRQLQGFIESINTTGSGKMVTNGRKMILNDPLGRFGPKYTANPLWSIDPDNPSIRTATGFPACVPRSASDTRCPSKNRPTSGGKPVQKLTFKNPSQLSASDPDPRFMMLLAAGDYVTCSGVDLGSIFAIYALTANLGVYTAPGTKPAYVTVEDAQYAVVQNAANGEDGETRAVASCTDLGASLQMYALDQDPCTGAFTRRNLQSVAVDSDTGKADFRSRYVGFDASAGTGAGPENITAGTFVQPVFEYVVPELNVFGDPEIAIEFTKVPYLAKGSGPWTPGNPLTTKPASPPRVGQLDP